MNYTKNQILDFKKWYVDRPDSMFSPERNKKIIAETIEKSKKMAERKRRDWIEQLRERTDAVATYLKAVDRGKEPNVPRYFGRRMLAHLRGQRIVEEIVGRTRRLIEIE